MKPQCPAWAPPLLALQFLTRVPVPGVGRLSEEAVRIGLGRAVAWFPLVGAIVGAITAGTLLLTEQIWPRLIAVILALIIEALITGAFHEDAVADFCDGIGGGRNPEHVRQIMKDSRIGSYGALGLTLGVSLRAGLVFALSDIVTAPAIIAAATLGRLAAVAVMATTSTAPSNPRKSDSRESNSRESNACESNACESNACESNACESNACESNACASNACESNACESSARERGSRQSNTGITNGVELTSIPPAPTSRAPIGLAGTFSSGIGTRDVALAFAMALPGLLPFALIAPLHLLCAVLATTAFLIYFRSLLLRRVGGATGDCLGFAVYATQVVLLLTATAW